MGRDHTIKGGKYYDCDLCGITYRYNDLVVNSAGLRVCRVHCLDTSDYRFRDPQAYDVTLPVFPITYFNKYYQLKLIAGILVAAEIPYLDFIPITYIVGGDNVYQLLMYGGALYIKTGINGRRFPYLYSGVNYYLAVDDEYLYYNSVE